MPEWALWISSQLLNAIKDLFCEFILQKLNSLCYDSPVPAMVLSILNERSGYRAAVWMALPLRSSLCALDTAHSSLQEKRNVYQDPCGY